MEYTIITQKAEGIMKKTKTCENCIYFERHYAKIDGKLVKVGCGHCANGLVPPKKRRRCPLVKSCKLYMD